MPQKSTGRSTTTRSRIGNRNTRSTGESPDLEEPQVVEQITEAPTAEVETPAPAEPKAKTMGGMIERMWSGYKNWLCPRCGIDTFDEKEASLHTCNGREIRLYKGDTS